MSTDCGYHRMQYSGNDWFYGFVIAYTFNNKLDSIMDFHWTALKDLSDTDLMISPGLRYHINKQVTILFSIGKNAYVKDDSSSVTRVYLGVQLNIGK